MTKGVSEKFDEHERDTARRDYPQEVVDGTKRTTKMAKANLSELRTESGTRPAITRDLIEKMRGVLPHHSGASAEDAHSRPTIELTTFKVMLDEQGLPTAVAQGSSLPTLTPSEPVVLVTPPPISATALAPSTDSIVTTSTRRERSPIAIWVIGVVLVGLVLMVSAAGAVGFFFGRRRH